MSSNGFQQALDYHASQLKLMTGSPNLDCNIEVQDVDLINDPPHYKAHPSGIECIEVTEHMGFCLGNVVKYIWRVGLKEDVNALDDLKKAAWYLNREISRLEDKNG